MKCIRKDQKIFILIFFAIILFITNARGQAYLWATTSIGNLDEKGYSVKADHENNIITVGSFSGGADFDPGPGLQFLNAQLATDIFITKCTSDGQLIWAKNIGGDDHHLDPTVAVDVKGNIYITGVFNGKSDFDPGIDTFFLTSRGDDAFIVKLDMHGNFIWAHAFGGSQPFSSDRGYAVATDRSSSVYIGGTFVGKTDFDPGPGINELTPLNGDDGFLLKLTSEGDFVYARSFTSSGSSSVNGIQIDQNDHIYVCGPYGGTMDLDPGINTFNSTSRGSSDAFLVKLDPFGSFEWGKNFGSKVLDENRALAIDPDGYVYMEVGFYDTLYIDHPSENLQLNASFGYHIAVIQYAFDGTIGWVKDIGSDGSVYCNDIVFRNGNIYHTGWMTAAIDFDPDTSDFILTPFNKADAYVSSLDRFGNFRWAILLASNGYVQGNGVDVDTDGNVIATGTFELVMDLDPGPGIIQHNATTKDSYYTVKYAEKGVTGSIYADQDQSCIREAAEKGLRERIIEIQPGNIVVQTGVSGIWYLDSLTSGTYQVSVDTSENWKLTCENVFEFTVNDPSELTITPGIGLKDIHPCAEPEISVFSPGLNRCAPDQTVYVRACNLIAADQPLSNAYVEIILDEIYTLSEMSLPFISIGENSYRVELGTLLPGQCVQFHLKGIVDCDALLGQTICIQAYLFPVDSCAIQSAETPGSGLPPCAYETEESDLSLDGWCANDSIFFSISNLREPGIGDMHCFSQIRLLIDGEVIITDSIQLGGGERDTLVYSGDGRTWRMEVDQHPLHPGRSKPNATVELCGNQINWTPELGIILPQDDAEPVASFYCDVVRGPYDPNDKTGFPFGVGDDAEIAPDTRLEYRIRFQNTGNDTALTVIVRDTLDEAFDIFSIHPGVSSHAYRFRVYGPRVLEWIFDNIQLPDSNVNYEASNGFLTFSADLEKGLPHGTQIFNQAAIYFDYNEPILTNHTIHTISDSVYSPGWKEVKEIQDNGCKEILYNGISYTHSGQYWQISSDTLLILALNISEPNITIGQLDGTLTSNSTALYQWIDCEDYSPINGATLQSFTPAESGNYAVIVDESGCVDTSDCYFVQVVSLGDQFTLSDVIISPNPTAGSITIGLKAVYKNIVLEITDMNGRVLNRSEFIDKEIIPVELLNIPGLYFLHVRADEKVGVFGVIRQ